MAATTAVVTTGRAIITSRLIGTATAIPAYVAWGTGSVAVVIGDTTLTEPGEARTLTVPTQTTTTTSNDTFSSVGTITATGTRTIAEVGLFTAASAGTLFLRSVLASTISVNTSDTVQFTITVQVLSTVV